MIENTSIVEKEDLDLVNHLSGIKRTCLRVQFRNVNDLYSVKKVLTHIVAKNELDSKSNETYSV